MMRILDKPVLDGTAAGGHQAIALPSRLGGLGAAPVRAVLRSLA